MSPVSSTLQAFFTDRLMTQRQVSSATVAAYRDTFRLLLAFVTDHKKISPSDLDFTDLDALTIGEFLNHLETERANSIRTRNARLAAIRSMFRFAAFRHPEHALTGAVDPTQTYRPDDRGVPDQARDRSDPRRP
jgi:integrase/recombinase XerD